MAADQRHDVTSSGDDEKRPVSRSTAQSSPIVGSKEDDYGDQIKAENSSHIPLVFDEQAEEEQVEPRPARDAEEVTALPSALRRLSRVEKTKSRISVNNISAIPNGGLRAWLQVVGSFFIFFNTWGIINTYGVYQTYYELDILTTSTPSSIAWIGSIQAFLLQMVSAITGPIYDAGYFYELLWGGSFFVVFGHMMLSLCTKYYQVLLTQAICIGCGAGLLFVPGVAIISTYFTTKLAFATGAAAVGSSLGGVLYPIMLNQLIPQVGFPWAVRIIGFLCLATLSVPLLSMKVRVLPTDKRPLVDWSALRQFEFVFFVAGMTVGFLGLYSLFYYVQSYVIARHTMTKDLAFYLLSLLNAASAFGRLLPNILADKIGPLNCLVPATICSGAMILVLIAADSTASVIVIVMLFGFFSGTFVSLPATIVVHMTKNRGLIGTRLGMCFASVSIGMLIGPPIQGAILSAAGYDSVWCFGGLVTIAGGALLVGSRVMFKGWKLNVRA